MSDYSQLGLTVRFRPEYNAFKAARQRCTNPKDKMAKYYSERGIKFLFSSFREFLDHIGPRPKGMTLDRVNNSGNYEIGNVRWTTQAVQNINKRRPNFDWIRMVSGC